MASWNECSDCLLCHKKAIEHRYLHNGERFIEVLHQNEDDSVVVCVISGSFSHFMRCLNDGCSDISLDKEKSRRQEYWKGRRLPRRFVSHREPAQATKGNNNRNGGPSTLNDDAAKSSTFKSTTEKTTAAVGETSIETSIETTSDNRRANNKEDPPQGSAPAYKTINDWADFWRYDIGVNVIPADTRRKVTYESWVEWQDKPIPSELHNEWKESGVFNNGIAIILGKVWHNPNKAGLYLNGIDLDNQKAILETCNRDVSTISLSRLSQWTLVEQHLDDLSTAHVLIYSHRPFPKKSSDKHSLSDKLDSNEIPAIEVKGLGSHGILFVSPSVHKNGHHYQILGTKEPVVADDFVIHIDNIFKKYSIPYLEAARENGNGIALAPIHELFKPDVVIYEGHNRHEALLRAMDSLLSRNKDILSQDQIISLARQWNNQHCIPPLDEKEFSKQWKCATVFISRNKTAEKRGGEDGDDDLCGINSAILQRLSPHVYSVVSSDPPVMYVAHKGKRGIIKAVIKFATETSSSNSKLTHKIVKQLLLWKQRLILATPLNVIINENPLDDTKTYQITFMGRSKKLFTVGPGSIKYIIDELVSKGKVLKKEEAVDALTAIINRFEELGLAEVRESVTQPGYYYIKGKFETYQITQVVDKEPDPEQVVKCINILDELATKWNNKDIFPTVIKWTSLTPFNYILKANNKWLKNIHDLLSIL